MSRYFLTADLHSNGILAKKLLETAGVPLSPKERATEEIVSVQLGDLANCVARDANIDIALLENALEWYDVILVGNHEHPYWGGKSFHGFFHLVEVKERLMKLERLLRIRPCLLVGDVLITHAGLSDSWGFTSAWDAAEAIEEAWRSDPGSHPLLAAIGHARYGSSPEGGILWSDFGETRAPFRQIHGHTPMSDGPWVKVHGDSRFSPQREPRLHPHASLNLDAGGKHGDRVFGAWLYDGGRIDVVGYSAS